MGAQPKPAQPLPVVDTFQTGDVVCFFEEGQATCRVGVVSAVLYLYLGGPVSHYQVAVPSQPAWFVMPTIVHHWRGPIPLNGMGMVVDKDLKDWRAILDEKAAPASSTTQWREFRDDPAKVVALAKKETDLIVHDDVTSDLSVGGQKLLSNALTKETDLILEEGVDFAEIAAANAAVENILGTPDVACGAGIVAGHRGCNVDNCAQPVGALIDGRAYCAKHGNERLVVLAGPHSFGPAPEYRCTVCGVKEIDHERTPRPCQ